MSKSESCSFRIFPYFSWRFSTIRGKKRVALFSLSVALAQTPGRLAPLEDHDVIIEPPKVGFTS